MHFVETIIAYLRHAARSTRPLATMQASVSDVTLCHHGEWGEQCLCHTVEVVTAGKGERSEQCLGEARLWLAPHR